ncbi:MAG: hypothetical protein K6F69_01395, partial [Treponema sp.]|nr:hypothetical protein [Treponema sp.]
MPIVSNFTITEKSSFTSAVRAYLPKEAIVPFMQENNCRCRSLVKAGDVVREGQVIASPVSIIQNGMSANIHSPLPGTVKEIRSVSLPDGKRSSAAVISVHGAFSFLGKKNFPAEWRMFSPETLQRMIADKGIINTFETPYSLASQIGKMRPGARRFVVVRLFDEDPSRMTDSFVSNQYPAQVAEGIAIIATALQANGVIAIYSKKDNCPLTQEITSRFFEKIPFIAIPADTSKYPCGYKAELMAAVKKSAKETSIFAKITHRELFIDPETAYSVYEAVVCGVPVLSKFVHVTGDCLKTAAMFKTCIGTSIGFLASQCGGFIRNPAKIIVNGLYAGNAVASLDTPITKIVKSITFLPLSEMIDPFYVSCVRCGECRRACPHGLYPD